jgi:hypothetical protein
VCAIAGGTTTFGGIGGGVGFDSGAGACGVGASGFGSVDVTGGIADGVAVTRGTDTTGAGICGFCSGAASGFFSVGEIGGAVTVLSGGCGVNCEGTAIDEGIGTCG